MKVLSEQLILFNHSDNLCIEWPYLREQFELSYHQRQACSTILSVCVHGWGVYASTWAMEDTEI